MVVRLNTVIAGANTAQEGRVVYDHLLLLSVAADPVISFEGLDVATSSFTNASFLRFAQTHGLEALRRVRIIHASAQIKKMLKERVIGSKALETA